MAAPKQVSQLPRYKPAVLVVHSGPGNNSTYLEPMAIRLCDVQGRSCYLYDQLQGGHNRRSRLKHDTRDLLDVANYLLEHLGEPEIHIIAHGFGGVMVMEAVVRMQLWKFGGTPNCLPAMRSVCLLGTPSSSVLLQSESKRLLQLAQRDGSEEAKSATSFWFKHYCSLRSPSCLENVYNRQPLGGWEPWDTWVLRGWEMSRSELAEEWATSTCSAPLLMVRGENDFVTEACMEAWRGAQDSLQAAALEGRPCSMGSLGFQEKVIPRSGHNAHLEEPEVTSALLHEWLEQVEGAL